MRTLSAFLCLCLAGATGAETLPESLRAASEQPLKQCSTGVIEVWGFIDVGKASVWLPDCERLEMPLQPPLMLRFGYDREVPGHAFARSARAMLQRNMDESTYRELQEQFETFNSSYRDTQEGDVYSMLWQEDGSVTLWLNDRKLAEERGERFARHYLKIWFGPDPYSDKLKQALLTPAS